MSSDIPFIDWSNCPFIYNSSRPAEYLFPNCEDIQTLTKTVQPSTADGVSQRTMFYMDVMLSLDYP